MSDRTDKTREQEARRQQRRRDALKAEGNVPAPNRYIPPHTIEIVRLAATVHDTRADEAREALAQMQEKRE